MTRVTWDAAGERLYETGVSNGMLYLPNVQGIYNEGFVWNGLTAVTESPSGAEANAQYADNIKYLNLISAEEFAFTIEAFTYPEKFAQCDGTASPVQGFAIGQQARKTFGFAYRTKVGNDLVGDDFGYKLHLVWNCLAAPSEKAYSTVNDSPEPIAFSWEVSTTAMHVGAGYRPTATVTIDSTKVNAAKLEILENLLYGTSGTDPRLPTPAEVLAIFEGSNTEVSPEIPTFNSETGVITIPSTVGVNYRVNGDVVVGTYTISVEEGSVIVAASPAPGYYFPANVDDDWLFERD